MTAPLCTWCGHPAHDHPCPRTITTGSGKTKTETNCPCSKEKP